VTVSRTIGYGDAVALLGGESPTMAALDRALGGLLLVATAGTSELVLSVFDAKAEGVRFGHEIVASLRDRVRGFSRFDRTQRLHAAHAVVVVTAFFEALDTADVPLPAGELREFAVEQLSLTGEYRRRFVDELLTAETPMPAPHRSHEDLLAQLRDWYRALSDHLARIVAGLAVWDRLDDRRQREIHQTLADLPNRAIERYEILYRRLAVDIAEFAFWSNQREHQATRSQLGDVRRSLAELEHHLQTMSDGRAPDDRRAALARAYRAALDRPILAEGDPASGLTIPTLAAGYLDPDFRLRSADEHGTPAHEGWWESAEIRSDLSEALVGLLTEPATTVAPLLVLGQPGAGKSVLTRVLAARLPAQDFLPIRVELRDVPGDADLQDQIEYAVRAATGEALTWPDLVRSAGDALPVVLLDGFDELLQATGVSQSDYLTRVVRFQQREADQGRPVAVVVTSRIAVADRARVPLRSRVVRLEPFRAEQVEQWLAVWNSANAGYLAARGVAALSPETVLRHPDLASQPLLLLMLAIYDIDDNALQRGAGVLDQAGLYDRLLHTFAEREVRKDHSDASDTDVAGLVDRELLRLAVTAFAMYNRGRQWTTSAELDADLAALMPERPREPEAGFRAGLSRGQTVVGRFFFVQRAQAVRDGSRVESYEFLHATFGEYLVARLVHQVLADLARQEAAAHGSLLGATRCQDGLLYALLSFAPLTNRGAVVTFLSQIAAGEPEQQRTALRRLAIVLFQRLDERSDDRFSGYAPALFPITSRYARYSLNLVLLAAVYGDQVRTSELFTKDDPIEAWRRHALLWQSTLAAEEWRGLLYGTLVRREWAGDRREVVLHFDDADDLRPAAPLDMHWTFGKPPTDEQRGHLGWGTEEWPVLNRLAALLCDQHFDIVTHALEPALNLVGDAITNFVGWPDRAESVAHRLLQAWLGADLGIENDQLISVYESIFRAIEWGWPPWDEPTLGKLIGLATSRLAADAPRLPPDALAGWLHILHASPDHLVAPHHASLIDTALSGLGQRDLDESDRRRLLSAITGYAGSHSSSLRAWVGLHELGWIDHVRLWPPEQSEEDYLHTMPWAELAAEDPRLVTRARWLAHLRHPHLSNEPAAANRSDDRRG
jgi:hypothetical protein